MAQITQRTLESPNAVKLIKATLFKARVQNEEVSGHWNTSWWVKEHQREFKAILDQMLPAELSMLIANRIADVSEISRLSEKDVAENLSVLAEKAGEKIVELYPNLREKVYFFNDSALAKLLTEHPERILEFADVKYKILLDALSSITRANDLGTEKELRWLADQNLVFFKMLLDIFAWHKQIGSVRLRLDDINGETLDSKTAELLRQSWADGELIAELDGHRKKWGLIPAPAKPVKETI